MTNDSLKKLLAGSVTAAMLIAGPGLPLVQAAGDLAAVPAGAEVSGPSLAAPVALPGASVAPADGVAGAGAVLELMNGLADQADQASARAAAGDQAAASRAADALVQLQLLSQKVSFIDPAMAQKAADIQARAAVARQRLDKEQQRKIDAGMIRIASALAAHETLQEQESAAVAAARTDESKTPRLAKFTQRAGLAAGALALSAKSALAYNGYDRFADAQEPSTYDWIMGLARGYAPYAAGALGVAGLAVIVRSMLFQVPQGYVFITNLLGKHKNEKTPGLRSKVPFIQTIRQRLSVQSQTEPLKFRAITSDQAVVDFDATMTYAVLDHQPETLKKAAYTFRSREELMAALKSSVEGSIRSFIATKKQSEVNGLRNEIVTEVKKHLDERVAGWGYKIENVQVNDVSFDPEVRASMDEIVNSQAKLQTAISNAETLVTNVVRAAKAEGMAFVTQRTAEADAQISEGKGVAEFRGEATQGIKAAVDTGLSETFIALMMQLDTLRKIAKDGKGNAMIINGSPSGLDAMQQKIAEMLARSASQKAGDQAKDKAGSAVSDNPNSGVSGLWLLGSAAALMGFAALGFGVLPYVGGVLALTILAKSMLFVVPEGYVDVVEQFSQYHSVKKAGLNLKIPFIQTIRRVVSLQYRTQKYDGVRATTSDQANITFNATLIYKVKDSSDETIKTVAYRFIDDQNFQNQLKSSVENSIRAIVNTKKQAEILGVRQELADQARVHLGEEMAGYGYELVDLQINDIGFDDNMLKNMAGVVTARNRALAAANNSQAEALLVEKKAEAEGERTKILGESRREGERQRGRGVRGYAEEASKGLKEAIEQTGLNAELVMMILAQDAMREIATAGSGHVIDMQETAGGDANARKIMQLDLAKRAGQQAGTDQK